MRSARRISRTTCWRTRQSFRRLCRRRSGTTGAGAASHSKRSFGRPSGNLPSFIVELTSAAAKDLRRLDPPVRRRVLRILEVLRRTPYPEPGLPIKPLVGASPPQYRLRIGDYRVVYLIEASRILVVRVAHRREVYRTLWTDPGTPFDHAAGRPSSRTAR